MVKPSQAYQLFDSVGNPISEADTQLIEKMVQVGFKHDGLQTGYPNGEPVWHYVKDLQGYSTTSLLQSYNKNSKRNIKIQKVTVSGFVVSIIRSFQLSKIIEETGARQGFEDRDSGYYNSLLKALVHRQIFSCRT